MQREAAYHLFQSFKKVILCIIDEFISSLPKAENLIFEEKLAIKKKVFFMKFLTGTDKRNKTFKLPLF